jgi:hypothetical protein
MAARAALLACALAVTLCALAPGGDAAPLANAAARGSAGQAVTAARLTAAAAAAPVTSANFPGLNRIDTTPPDPNAAASPTQIVEVVNVRLQVYTRGGAVACSSVDLNSLFGVVPGEKLTDPRVIYDSVGGHFVVMISVMLPAPPSSVPHLPLHEVLDMAYNATSDACAAGAWVTKSIDASDDDIPEGFFIDQPTMGQDRDAFLFGGASGPLDESESPTYVAFSYPKNCFYAFSCTDPISRVFFPAHYAAPASSGGSPMITTTHSYFVAAVPNAGYELYKMDNSGNASATTFGLQATIAAAQATTPPTRNAGQPATQNPITINASSALSAVRIKTPATFDGTRVWFTHQSSAGISSPDPAVRYGAVNVDTNTVATAVAYHGPDSDDFNSSIAVGMTGGASRTIFLNWAYSDVKAGLPVTPTVAAVTIAAADPPPPLIGKDVPLWTVGGITSDNRFGDYSSTAIDPVSQACAVTAQEYFESPKNGNWATQLSRFGPSGC